MKVVEAEGLIKKEASKKVITKAAAAAGGAAAGKVVSKVLAPIALGYQLYDFYERGQRLSGGKAGTKEGHKKWKEQKGKYKTSIW